MRCANRVFGVKTVSVPYNLSGGVQGVGEGDQTGKTPSGKGIKKKKDYLTGFLPFQKTLRWGGALGGGWRG